MLQSLTADDFLTLTVRDVRRRQIAQTFCSVAIGGRFQYAHDDAETYTKTSKGWATCSGGKKWKFSRYVWVVAC